MQLHVIVDDLEVRLVPIGPAPKLVRRGRRLVAMWTIASRDLPQVDLAGTVEEERNLWP